MKKIKDLLKYPFLKIYKLFLWASGADLDILKKAPIDNNKYFGIGGTIVFTALMASFAGGYAFFTAFREEIYTNISNHAEFAGYTTTSILLSIFFGIFWGSLIFNLDRYIVSTFGVGDGKKTISKQELIEAFPRILMAILLGFVIATPLELKLFEREINAEISTQIEIVKTHIIKSGENDPVLKRLREERDEISNNIKNRLNIIEEKRLFWAKANKEKNDEWNFGKQSGKKGKGEVYQDLKREADEAEDSYTTAKNDFSSLNEKGYARIDEIDKKIKDQELLNREDIENQKTVQAQNNGLMARLKALDNLSYDEVPIYKEVNGERKAIGTEKEKSVVWYARWLVTLMFIFIEIAPILFKMMTERGPYDDISDRLKHEAKVKQLLLQSNLNEEINVAVKINTDKNAQKLNAELASNEKLLNTIAQAQAEISIIAIESWKKEQIKKVKDDPSSIIKS